MHTLSAFPELLTYNMFAPFVLRVILGFIAITLGYLKLKKEKSRWNLLFESLRLKPASLWTTAFGYVEIIGGIALIVGFSTQIAALVFAVISFCELYIENKESALLKRDLAFYLLLCAISVSLIFSGPGFFAFDLPL